MRTREDEKKKKKKKSVIETEIMRLMEACLQQAIKTALKDIEKSFK